MNGFTKLLFSVFALVLVVGCGGQTGEEVAQEEPAAEMPAEAPSHTEAVMASINASVESTEGVVTMTHPGTGEEVTLTFDHVHEGVMETEDGRYATCVDFKDAEGTVYDVDYIMTMAEDGSFMVAETMMHKVGGEEVMASDE